MRLLGLHIGTIISLLFSILTDISYAQYQPQPDPFQQQVPRGPITLDISSRDRASGRAIAAVGDSATILCQHNAKVDYCRFVLPDPQDDRKTVVVSDQFASNDPNIEYFGTGLANGQCGITIKNVLEKYNGNVTCSAGAGPNEFYGQLNFLIAKPPLQPEIEEQGPPNRNGFEVGRRISWKCLVRDGRPPAQIQWFLKDGEQYYQINSMNPHHRFEVSEDHLSQLSTSIQLLERVIQAEDDGKLLVCRSIHAETRTVNEATFALHVRYAPTGQRDVDIYGLQLDKSNTINVQIKSNPRPHIEWKIDGNVIEERNRHDRFLAPELQQVGPNLYNATLVISPLMIEDLTKTYYLAAFNEIGRSDFTVRISSADTPAEGLEMGAIVGIIVVLAVLFLVILLVVFARVTGRWCFATKSPKSPTSETPDEFQYTKNGDNKSNKNLNSGVGGGNGGDPLLTSQGHVIQIENNPGADGQQQRNQRDQQKTKSSICCGIFNKKNNDNIQYTLTSNNDFFDTDNDAVYNSTTVPIEKDGKKSSSKGKRPASPQIRRTHNNKKSQKRTPSYAEAVGISRASMPSYNPKDDAEFIDTRTLESIDDSNEINIKNNDILLNELNNRLKTKNKSGDEIQSDKYKQQKQQHQQPDVIKSGHNVVNNDNSNLNPKRDSKVDLLTRGNELGIPGGGVGGGGGGGGDGSTVPPTDAESRLSKWIPKDQRELLGKQARILSNVRTPPPVPAKPPTKKLDSNIIDDSNKSKDITTDAIDPKLHETEI